MILQEGILKLNFSGVKNAFRFDEEDRSSQHFHGLSHCMKAVDFIAEYPDHYLFIEIKNPRDPSRYSIGRDIEDLINDLVVKFRDTFLYRWAEGKINKPVHYLCLIELDNAQTLHIMNKLKYKLPFEGQPSKWQKKPASKCAVVNIAAWNKTFSHIHVIKAEETLP